MKHKASQEAFFVAASGMLHSPFAHNEAAPDADNLPHGAVFPCTEIRARTHAYDSCVEISYKTCCAQRSC